MFVQSLVARGVIYSRPALPRPLTGDKPGEARAMQFEEGKVYEMLFSASPTYRKAVKERVGTAKP